MNFDWQYDEPNMVIKHGNKIKGDMKFDGFLKVDGEIVGKLIANTNSKVMISNTGSYTGDLSASAALINGHLIGNIFVEDLYLGSNAVLYGEVQCKHIKIEYGASIVGQLLVSTDFVLNQESNEIKSIIEHNDLSNNSHNQLTTIPSEEASTDDKYFGFYRKPPKKAYRSIVVIVEPQVDFYPGGSIYSEENPHHNPEASITTQHIADFITNNIENITDIVILLDSHNHIHVASSGFWVNKMNQSPSVNTLIRIKDVQEGIWLPRKEESLDYCISILQQLELSQQLYGTCEQHSHNNDKVGIEIKPEHCMLGSFGSSIVPIINQAIDSWVNCTLRNPVYIVRFRNSNFDIFILNYLEVNHLGGGYKHIHKPYATSSDDTKNTFFSGAGADDIIEMTNNNTDIENNNSNYISASTLSIHKCFYDLSFLNLLKNEDKLYMCGQLRSHCVEFSITDIVNTIASSSAEICSENIFILKDTITTSNNLKGINKELSELPAIDSTVVISSNIDNSENEIWNSLVSCGINIIASSEILL